MATKIPLCVMGPPSKDPSLGSYRIYNPVFVKFYISLGSDFNLDTEILGREFAKWGAIYKATGEYILFKRDEDATMFLLRFS